MASKKKGLWSPLSSPESNVVSKRILARVFRMAALYHVAIDDPESAFTYLKACCEILDPRFSDFPDLLDYWVRISISSMVLDGIWHGLKEGRWNEHHLREIEILLRRIQLQDSSLTLSLRVERAELAWLALEHEHHEIADFISPYANLLTKLALNTFPGTQVPYNFVQASNNYQKAIHILEMPDQALQTESWSQFQQMIETQQQNAFDGSSDHDSLLWAITASSFDRTLSISRRAQVFGDLARVAVAAERFRLAEGEYPGALDDLSPKILDAVPTDRITGQPLIYSLQKDGRPRIYSVGWNAEDDGGAVYKDHQHGDWVWHHSDAPVDANGYQSGP